MFSLPRIEQFSPVSSCGNVITAQCYILPTIALYDSAAFAAAVRAPTISQDVTVTLADTPKHDSTAGRRQWAVEARRVPHRYTIASLSHS
jgi:hypothetical protein